MSRHQRIRVGGAVAYASILTLLFAQPLGALIWHAVANSLHSHIPLVPFVAGYLLYSRAKSTGTYRSSLIGGLAAGAVGLGALVAGLGWREAVSVNDALALTTFAYVSFVAAGGFWFFGSSWMVAASFPVGFLLFMVPLPDQAAYWLERGSVLASADVAAFFFTATGTPLFRDGTVLALPGIVLEVAQECSGIRSSWVLFITSFMASDLFLRSPWRRLALVAFVIPLGIVRNAFRILVLGLLCVHIGPQMIYSEIHRQGGPLFFALSLGPMFFFLWWLRGRERRSSAPPVAVVSDRGDRR